MLEVKVLGLQQATCFFSSSAVRRPMATLNLERTNFMISSSKVLPATFTLVARTLPPRLITAISVVPPPMSTTMWPVGSRMSMPEPMAAAMGSSIRNTCRAPAATTASTTASLSMPVMAAGTHTATRGLIRRES